MYQRVREQRKEGDGKPWQNREGRETKGLGHSTSFHEKSLLGTPYGPEESQESDRFCQLLLAAHISPTLFLPFAPFKWGDPLPKSADVGYSYPAQFHPGVPKRAEDTSVYTLGHLVRVGNREEAVMNPWNWPMTSYYRVLLCDKYHLPVWKK